MAKWLRLVDRKEGVTNDAFRRKHVTVQYLQCMRMRASSEHRSQRSDPIGSGSPVPSVQGHCAVHGVRVRVRSSWTMLN